MNQRFAAKREYATMTRQQFLRTLSAGTINFVAGRAQAQPSAPETLTYKTAGREIHADVYGQRTELTPKNSRVSCL